MKTKAIFSPGRLNQHLSIKRHLSISELIGNRIVYMAYIRAVAGLSGLIVSMCPRTNWTGKLWRVYEYALTAHRRARKAIQ